MPVVRLYFASWPSPPSLMLPFPCLSLLVAAPCILSRFYSFLQWGGEVQWACLLFTWKQSILGGFILLLFFTDVPITPAPSLLLSPPPPIPCSTPGRHHTIIHVHGLYMLISSPLPLLPSEIILWVFNIKYYIFITSLVFGKTCWWLKNNFFCIFAICFLSLNGMNILFQCLIFQYLKSICCESVSAYFWYILNESLF